MRRFLSDRHVGKAASLLVVLYTLCVIGPAAAIAFGDSETAAHCLTDDHLEAAKIHVHQDGSSHQHSIPDDDHGQPGKCCGLFAPSAIAPAIDLVAEPHSPGLAFGIPCGQRSHRPRLRPYRSASKIPSVALSCSATARLLAAVAHVINRRMRDHHVRAILAAVCRPNAAAGPVALCGTCHFDFGRLAGPRLCGKPATAIPRRRRFQSGRSCTADSLSPGTRHLFESAAGRAGALARAQRSRRSDTEEERTMTRSPSLTSAVAVLAGALMLGACSTFSPDGGMSVAANVADQELHKGRWRFARRTRLRRR